MSDSQTDRQGFRDTAMILHWAQEVARWVNGAFDGHQRDAAYATLAWVVTKYPEVAKILCAEVIE